MGTSGSDVEKLQQRLAALGYLSSANVTNYFGEVTFNALKSFQQVNGLTVDGTAGKQTMNALYSSNAKKKPTTSSSNNNSNKSSSSSSSSSSNTGTPAAPATNTSGVDAFIAAANSKLGSKYVTGGKGPNTFDCSGFIYWCLNQAGISQGYMNSVAWKSCTKYPTVNSLSQVQRGDILLFSGASVGHMGIALGNGMMIDASSGNGKVVIRSCTTSYWQKHFIRAYRAF
ncbi:NlpC/P60 family protein [Clostridia bacterium OttesenSCG-928-F22]|nr:NlpC/P60 family protein [Clostridia bacterium OttesenSCG-928-F22]